MFRIVENIDSYRTEYQRVQRWYTPLKRIATILEPSENKTSHWVEKRLSQYLQKLQRTLSGPSDHPFIDNLMRYSKGFWKGLFTFYDYPIIPRTNNELELFFRRTKQKHRRITGSRTWNRYIIRHGENIVFTDNVNNEQHALNQIQNVSYDDYIIEFREWKKRIFSHTKQRRFKQNPEDYLSYVEVKWKRHN